MNNQLNNNVGFNETRRLPKKYETRELNTIDNKNKTFGNHNIVNKEKINFYPKTSKVYNYLKTVEKEYLKNSNLTNKNFKNHAINAFSKEKNFKPYYNINEAGRFNWFLFILGLIISIISLLIALLVAALVF